MSSSRNTSNKASSLKWLPWVLLLIVIAAFIWLFTSMKTTSEATWEPPRTTPAEQQASEPVADTPAPISSYHNAVARASQSVVNIYTTQTMAEHPYMDDPVLRRFFEFHSGPSQEQGNTNLGSGVIVSEDGYIVTNAHVIEKADEITVAFNDGRKSRAKIIGTDPDSDLAVIKVDMQGLTPLGFRENPIRVGDLALAIGNPFGVGQTVTQGIISATGRTGLGVNKFEDFIQTDAAINPGNSGGALVDARGELVGINTVIFSRSGGSMGIGFAIPTAIVEQVMNALIKDGKVSRGWLGIEIQSQLRDPTQLETSTGVEVLKAIKNSPAAKSGLKVGDIILTIDGVEMTDANTLIQYVARKPPNTELEAQVLRNGSNQQVTILLEERPEQQPIERPVVIHDETLGGRGHPSLQGEGQEVPMMSKEERDRMREELLQLFERDGAPR
ncbi:S1C family serine protease [Psychrobacter sp. AOP22-C1-22]|uniref:S1C family serine protease n=1 Tax=unclassified Psychrobacter TaxID=196806 RepID=UPI0017887310|nr:MULTISPECIES: trypsin-like peptidase domain-containing protein [unclassified Psychrobacter]MBE0407976.1 trypsin-like peptidase domain-containing protein [Psychrobacter sp. FME6]MBE0444835.1 trypsin-like peptidase domain-containing protein [Psychrobacter sp. FME5]MDN5802810.1 trypsin-like peptidase domain-containing protein [Psychrobacter sp.]MDN5891490.1 trypsin-like peptidase domain-containing protein [Psychrobacter sp.]